MKRFVPALSLVVVALFVPSIQAQDHVLPLSDLHSAISQATANRQANRTEIDRFFAEPRVKTTLTDAGINVNQLRQAASLMTDDEQSELASRVRKANADIAGGELKDAQVTLIIMAVAAFCFLAVLVLAFK